MGLFDLSPLTVKGRQGIKNFFMGSPERFEQRSLLEPGQQKLKNQLFGAAQGNPEGGAFGDVYNYYSGLLNDQNSTYNALEAPELRQFREQIIPGLAEQFAGMGASGTNYGGFANAAVGAGTDLAERLGAIRAQLRQQGAQGLMGLGQQGLQQFTQTIHRPETPGFLGRIAPAAGAVAGMIGGPAAGAIGKAGGDWLSSLLQRKGSPVST